MNEDPNKKLDFEPIFDLRGGAPQPASDRDALADPDSRQGLVYRMPNELHLAVEVALTTGRPLLLRGEPGTGKSSLAPYIARRLNWRYYEHVVTSTSMAADLLWRFDTVRRLADAQAGEPRPEDQYVEPGTLWWALDRKSASKFAAKSGAQEPNADENAKRDRHRAVVLIDEIDKAHPDLPNGLLVAIGSHQIAVPYLDDPIEINADGIPLTGLLDDIEVAPIQVVITTNEERELPAAFVRRCITYRLQHPDPDQLTKIARAHFDRPGDPFGKTDKILADAIAERIEALRNDAGAGEHKPSTAEFLDAFRACRNRGITPTSNSEAWQLIERITLAKPAPVKWG